MAIIKCKMCGGDIELAPDKTFGTCDSCGSTMTFPKLDDEQRAAAFNRGNHFRRIGEFDKALAVYERIVREDDTDAEAHWCCALCRFGIEYVEDPATYEWLPTCHRASFDSFLEDVDYLAAIEHSDGLTRRQYQKDAAKIAEVQRGILATSQNTEPYDVFICYKESDENGDRTRDSLLAQDIYYQLTEQGRKVFFARITLEDVVGSQYEPHIFAALNSAKVMIVVGTKPEYLNAVWVKNEWSRFLALMKKDHHKLLLPCYRDMDPYDMPEQLSILQSYDMGKIGFIQDLIRGIAKVLDADKKPEPVKETVVVNTASTATAPLLKRAFMFLEDGDFESADEYCEKVLDQDPENAQAYLGKLLVQLKLKKQADLQSLTTPFANQDFYLKTLRFADPELKKTLTEYNDGICSRNYDKALSVLESSVDPDVLNQASDIFLQLGNYRYSREKLQLCRERAEYCSRDRDYNKALSVLQNSQIPSDLNRARQTFQNLGDHRDAAEKADECAQKAKYYTDDYSYNNALKKMLEAKSEIDFKTAAAMFERIPNHRNAAELAENCRKKMEETHIESIYNAALRYEKNHYYRPAVCQYNLIPDYRDAKQRKESCEALLKMQESARKRRNLIIALSTVAAIIVIVLSVIIGVSIKKSNHYKKAETLLATDKAQAAMEFGKAGNYKDAWERSSTSWADLVVRKTEIVEKGYPDYIVQLEPTGTVTAVNHDYGSQVLDWKDIIAIEATSDIIIGLKSDGTVVVAGKTSTDKQLISKWKNIVAISLSGDDPVGLKADGTIAYLDPEDAGKTWYFFAF